MTATLFASSRRATVPTRTGIAVFDLVEDVGRITARTRVGPRGTSPNIDPADLTTANRVANLAAAGINPRDLKEAA